MILSTHGVLASQIASFDADAVAFFDRVTTAGGSLSLTEKQAVNTLVVDMKAYGIWSAMKAVYPMVGASAAACAQNLVSSSFTGTFTSGWTFASTGVTPNGTSSYMDTTVTNNIDLTDRQSHWSIYLRTINTGDGYFGYFNGSNVFGLQQKNTNSKLQIGGNNLLTTAINTTNGFILLKTDGASNKIYVNNTQTESQSTNSITQNLKFFIGALNNNGGGTFLYCTHQYAFSSLGDKLTDTQASNFYTAVQTFNTSLSRQV